MKIAPHFPDYPVSPDAEVAVGPIRADFAARAMQGLLAAGADNQHALGETGAEAVQRVAIAAIIYADALIEELNR